MLSPFTWRVPEATFYTRVLGGDGQAPQRPCHPLSRMGGAPPGLDAERYPENCLRALRAFTSGREAFAEHLHGGNAGDLHLVAAAPVQKQESTANTGCPHRAVSGQGPGDSCRRPAAPGGALPLPLVVGKATHHRFRFLRVAESDEEGGSLGCRPRCEDTAARGGGVAAKRTDWAHGGGSGSGGGRRGTLPAPRAAPCGRPGALTAQEHLELLVEELGLPVRHQGALRALPHRVHEAHAPQRHLLAAALVAEALPTPATVVLERPHGGQ